MSRLDNTLASLAPGVAQSRDLPGRYNPRRGLAIYCLPIPGYSPSAPGVVLGEALAARSSLGCTLLEGVPTRIPEGAVVLAQYNALRAVRPDLLEEVPELRDQGQYAIKLSRHALVTSPSREGLAAGMQTLAMLVLRHNEDVIPGCIILDSPFCHLRALAVELKSGEIGINLLMQIASFAATFKANRLYLILGDDFDAAAEIPGVESFVQTCQSYGIGVGVRLPWLGRILSGGKTILEAWAGLRAAARLFGADHAALDDVCPIDIEEEEARRIVGSIVKGEVGLKDVSVDIRLLERSGYSPAELKSMGVTGWYRMWEGKATPLPEQSEFPLRIDVQAPVPGFSSRDLSSYHRRLDTALGWMRHRPRRELVISFRDIGISHVWQNLLYPAATGLVAAWGNSGDAASCARVFANLLYGEAAASVMATWNAVVAAFPPGLTPGEEMLVRRTAFGEWPEDEESLAILAGIDWLEVTRHIRIAADALKTAAAGLSRNATTLAGAKLSLHALSWLHCFVALAPELERRRRLRSDDDGRTEPIAAELYNNFKAWQTILHELFGESGLELVEAPQIESMGLRLKGICEGIFE